MATTKEINQIWEMLTQAFPNNKVTPGTAKVYAMTLQDIDGDILRAAVLDCISRLTFFPAVAEIRAAATLLAAPDVPPALEEWGEVVRSVSRLHREPFDNSITEKCVDAIGWTRIRDSTNEVADRARFIELYNQYAERARREAVMLPVVSETRQRIGGGISGLVKKLTGG